MSEQDSGLLLLMLFVGLPIFVGAGLLACLVCALRERAARIVERLSEGD